MSDIAATDGDTLAFRALPFAAEMPIIVCSASTEYTLLVSGARQETAQEGA